MANSWLRLWHDMPNDPKWRTIAKVSGRSISEVMAVYLHLLVSASANASERGRTQANAEDVASALDMETDHVFAIFTAMENRVIEDGMLSGWNARQPEREDGSAARSRAWREKKAAEKESERKRTQTNASERLDKDKEEDKEHINPIVSDKSPTRPQIPYSDIFDAYADKLPGLPQLKIKDESRRKAIRSLWNQSEKFQTVDFWSRYFEYVGKSDFLTKQVKAIGFDWLMKPANFKKVIEGNYHGEPAE